MLELTKLEQRTANHGRLHTASMVSLSDCAQHAVDALQAQIAMKNIAVRINKSAAVRSVDADLVTLAVSNLLENAIDFSAAGSAIEVTCSERSIAVQDHAGGVPDYALARLGERFFTTPRPNGERSGSGLGLAIVRQIMALHGGQLALSNADGGLRAEMMFTT
jgi:two-component system, OmpR family, sensor histidine kinase CreC